MQGNDKDSKEYAARALRLQGSQTKTKPMYFPWFINGILVKLKVKKRTRCQRGGTSSTWRYLGKMKQINSWISHLHLNLLNEWTI